MNSLITVSNPMLFEMISVAGFGLYVMNYTLLTFHKLHSHDALYFAINLVAAALVLCGLMVSFNLASAMIQGFWVVISSAAIIIRLRRRTVSRRTMVSRPPGHQSNTVTHIHQAAAAMAAIPVQQGDRLWAG